MNTDKALANLSILPGIGGGGDTGKGRVERISFLVLGSLNLYVRNRFYV